MTFRDREKERLKPLKSQLFSLNAQAPGVYMGKPRDFCLSDSCSEENLHESIRTEALSYFAGRQIHWHDGSNTAPSNHLCCSQSFCANAWYPFVEQPHLLGAVLTSLGYSVSEILPFELDKPIGPGRMPSVAFEWIGEHNYLRERCRSVAQRQRGQNFTSCDFAFRFLRTDGKVQMVLGEWKYTEYYADGKCMQYSDSGTDRLSIYRESLNVDYCQIEWKRARVAPEALFFDPFDQLMRLQLLASEMENAHEMGADVVSVLHIAPRANTELMNRITSPYLRALGGSTIHDTWVPIVEEGRFKGVYTEDLLPIITKYHADKGWADWMQLRYGWS